MSDENILLKKVPDRSANILKGLGLIIVAAVFSFAIFFIIVLVPGGFLVGDVPGPNYSTTAWIVAGIVFLASFYKAIRIMMRPVK